MTLATERCPWCASSTEVGYGFAGDGLGPYLHCTNDECTYFVKDHDPDYPETDLCFVADVSKDPEP